MPDPNPTRPNASNRVPLGDRGWVGVDMSVDPAQLPPGYAAKAMNMRFELGVPETRKGRALLPWLNNIVAGTVRPWGVLHGRGQFKDPRTRRRYVLIAADGGIYRALEQNAPVAMTLPAGTTLTGTVRFTQAFNRVFCHRGFTLPTLELTEADGAWHELEEPPPGTGLLAMQDVERSLFLSDRLFTLQEDDEIGASDIGEPRYYLPFIQELAIKQGSADDLLSLDKLGKNSIVAIKDHSLHALYNVRGDLSDLQQHELTDEFGGVAADAVSRVGNELWILSQIGLIAIEEYAASENQSYLRIKSRQNERGEMTPVLVSTPLQPLFDRINWQYAHLARSARVESKYYLALPVDRAEVFGPELAPVGFVSASSTVRIPTTIGRTYRWVQTATESQLVNGASTYTTSKEFTAETTYVTASLVTLTFNGSVREVFKGVLNVIAVYDIEAGAWAGWDEAEEFGIRDLWTELFRGRERLIVAETSGFNLLYEETAEDQLALPYLDVVVASAPEVGDTIQVNGGATVTAWAFDFNAAGNQWGITGTSNNTPAANLFTDGTYGYYSGSTGAVWSAPNTLAVKITNGVRFYGTTGVLPSVVITGSWATVTYGKMVPIETTFITRAYALPTSSRLRGHRLTVNWETWSPALDVTMVKPGVNERTAIGTGLTRDRRKYTRPAHTPDYQLDNQNGDQDTPYREDYSVKFGPGGTAAGETESIDVDASGGMAFNLFQDARLNRRLAPDQDRALQVEIINRNGCLRLHSVLLEGADQRGNDGIAN